MQFASAAPMSAATAESAASARVTATAAALRPGRALAQMPARLPSQTAQPKFFSDRRSNASCGTSQTTRSRATTWLRSYTIRR